RFFLLRTHYRSPIDYSEERIQEAGTALDAFYRLFKRYQRVTGDSFYALQPPARRSESGDQATNGHPMVKAIQDHRRRFLEAMDDDFNTGGAVGDLFDLLRIVNKHIEDQKLETPAAQTPEHL